MRMFASGFVMSRGEYVSPTLRAYARAVVGINCIRPTAFADERTSGAKVDSWATSAATK